VTSVGRDVIAYLDYGWNSQVSHIDYVHCYTKVAINRNYDFFSILDSFPIKGLPEHISNAVFKDFFVYVPSNEKLEWYEQSYGYEYLSREEADNLVASRDCFYRTKTLPDGEHLYISDPAWYATTYLTLEECQKVIEKSRKSINYVDPDFLVAVEVMKLLNLHKMPDFVRIVMWSNS
jgi:hypothetical protein